MTGLSYSDYATIPPTPQEFSDCQDEWTHGYRDFLLGINASGYVEPGNRSAWAQGWRAAYQPTIAAARGAADWVAVSLLNRFYATRERWEMPS